MISFISYIHFNILIIRGLCKSKICLVILQWRNKENIKINKFSYINCLPMMRIHNDANIIEYNMRSTFEVYVIRTNVVGLTCTNN